MTAKIKNFQILKGLVDTKEFAFSAEQLSFIDRVDGPGRSFIKDPTPTAPGLLKPAAPVAPVRRLP